MSEPIAAAEPTAVVDLEKPSLAQAVSALYQLAKKKNEAEGEKLIEENQYIWLVISTAKIQPPNTKPVKL